MAYYRRPALGLPGRCHVIAWPDATGTPMVYVGVRHGTVTHLARLDPDEARQLANAILAAADVADIERAKR